MSAEDDGWRLTAYALGELSEAEREAVERWLASHPEAQAEVAAIRATAAELRDALSDEAMPGLLPMQRAAVLRGVATDGSSVAGGGSQAAATVAPANDLAGERGGRGLWAIGGALALAAGLLLAVGLGRLSGEASAPEADPGTLQAQARTTEPEGRAEIEAPPAAEAPVAAETEATARAPMDEATRLARAVSDGYREAPPYDSGSARAAHAVRADGTDDALAAGSESQRPASVPRVAARAAGAAAFADKGEERRHEGQTRLVAEGAEARPSAEPAEARVKDAEAPAAAPSSGRGGEARDLAAASAARPRGDRWRPPAKNRAPGVASSADAGDETDSLRASLDNRDPAPDLAKKESPRRGASPSEDGASVGRLGGADGSGVGGGGKGVSRRGLVASGPAGAAPSALAKAPPRGRVQAQEARPFPAQPVEAPEAESPVESYDPISEHPFRATEREPLSTFSADVDTASFTNVRRFLDRGELPPRDAVRIEEIVNWFPYEDPAPRGGGPFALRAEIAPCPWNGQHQLVRIALKAREVTPAQRPAANLVFLIDVSGSMQRPEKLPLLKQALTMLTQQLDGADRVAIVAYSGGAGVVLEPTTGADKRRILDTLANLRAGGSTNGSAGIALAYDIARRGLVSGGTNRVILATDGDFNVGTTGRRALEAQIAQEAATGIYLTVLGFGTGNLQDGRLEALSNRGNGQYAYIDSAQEAWRVLVEQVESTLVAVAKDVKIQVEFDPARVAAWRLVGYEDRAMANWEFHDDRRDAGDMGAGHSVNALYELVPRRPRAAMGRDLKYAPTAALDEPDGPSELLTVSVRYKAPDGDRSQRLDLPVIDYGLRLSQVSSDFRFAAAAATFAMLLRRSPYSAGATFGLVDELVRGSESAHPEDRRGELLRLSAIARRLMRR
jgi:Ca-activated chloride channel family protein